MSDNLFWVVGGGLVVFVFILGFFININAKEMGLLIAIFLFGLVFMPSSPLYKWNKAYWDKQQAELDKTTRK